MKVLVTGGTGYIGSHAVVELQQQGYEVVIIDNLSNSKKEVIYGIEKITGILPQLAVFDLCDESKTREFFLHNKDIEAVIHFAAYKSVGESVKEPLKYYQNNIMSSINLLESMKYHGISNLVFSSSCTVYGQPDKLPVTEDSPLKKAESPYGNTKKVMEDIIRDATNSSSLKAILLRYFNPIGAHESAYIGELPQGIPDNLLPYITQTAVGERDFLRVFGDDYDTPDGTPIRDYIHVVDLAKAHVVALERLLEGNGKSNCEVFNLGTGNGFSVLEVIKSFERVSGLKLNYQVVDRRPGDIVKVWADTTYANLELGWKADKGIDEMTGSAWKWQQKLEEEKKEN
jgi:UDP-glucose 4-epimerase